MQRTSHRAQSEADQNGQTSRGIISRGRQSQGGHAGRSSTPFRCVDAGRLQLQRSNFLWKRPENKPSDSFPWAREDNEAGSRGCATVSPCTSLPPTVTQQSRGIPQTRSFSPRSVEFVAHIRHPQLLTPASGFANEQGSRP